MNNQSHEFGHEFADLFGDFPEFSLPDISAAERMQISKLVRDSRRSRLIHLAPEPDGPMTRTADGKLRVQKSVLNSKRPLAFLVGKFEFLQFKTLEDQFFIPVKVQSSTADNSKIAAAKKKEIAAATKKDFTLEAASDVDELQDLEAAEDVTFDWEDDQLRIEIDAPGWDGEVRFAIVEKKWRTLCDAHEATTFNVVKLRYEDDSWYGEITAEHPDDAVGGKVEIFVRPLSEHDLYHLDEEEGVDEDVLSNTIEFLATQTYQALTAEESDDDWEVTVPQDFELTDDHVVVAQVVDEKDEQGGKTEVESPFELWKETFKIWLEISPKIAAKLRSFGCNGLLIDDILQDLIIIMHQELPKLEHHDGLVSYFGKRAAWLLSQWRSENKRDQNLEKIDENRRRILTPSSVVAEEFLLKLLTQPLVEDVMTEDELKYLKLRSEYRFDTSDLGRGVCEQMDVSKDQLKTIKKNAFRKLWIISALMRLDSKLSDQERRAARLALLERSSVKDIQESLGITQKQRASLVASVTQKVDVVIALSRLQMFDHVSADESDFVFAWLFDRKADNELQKFYATSDELQRAKLDIGRKLHAQHLHEPEDHSRCEFKPAGRLVLQAIMEREATALDELETKVIEEHRKNLAEQAKRKKIAAHSMATFAELFAIYQSAWNDAVTLVPPEYRSWPWADEVFEE